MNRRMPVARTRSFAVLIAVMVVLLVGGRVSASGEMDSQAGDAEGNPPSLQALAPALPKKADVWRGRFEVKRENTERGTPEETTKTTLKLDVYPDGAVDLLRLEVPLPDERTDFEGSPFHPRLGDIKTRFGFRGVPLRDTLLWSFVEVTFPTANPGSLGSEKYQLSVGLRMAMKVPVPDAMKETHKALFIPLVQQQFSVAGDEARKDINYTKLELAIRDLWREYWLQLKVKTVMDWEQNAKTGGVAELEGGRVFGPQWSAWLMLGTRLWGAGVPSTYGTRVSLGAASLF